MARQSTGNKNNTKKASILPPFVAVIAGRTTSVRISSAVTLNNASIPVVGKAIATRFSVPWFAIPNRRSVSCLFLSHVANKSDESLYLVYREALSIRRHLVSSRGDQRRQIRVALLLHVG